MQDDIEVTISFRVPRNIKINGRNLRDMGLNPRKLGVSPRQIREAILRALKDRSD